MTTFIDGPAKGQALALRRSPMFLRVVRKGEGPTWDALDQPEDTPYDDEYVFAYKLSKDLGVCHLNRGGGRSGFYKIAEYSFIQPQPPFHILRNTELWRGWCGTQIQ